MARHNGAPDENPRQEEKKMNCSLSDKAMLVSLSISKWSAKKLDKRATKEVLENHGAAQDAGRFNKELIARENLETLRKISNEARAYHYAQTLPWTDTGARILPAKNFDTYRQKMRDFRSDFESAVRVFADMYEDYKESARTRLNGLFREEDYPSRYDIAEKFGFEIDINPIPAAQDFRVDLQGEEVRRIKETLEARIERATAEAMRDLWERLYNAVSAIQERTSDDSDGKRKIFRDSIVGNLVELCDVLKRLNIAEDPTLEAMRRQVEERLCRTDPEDLRDDSNARKLVADDAAAILESMAGYMGYTPEKIAA
jgi:hypothetical protein